MATCKAIQEPLAAEWEKATRTHEFLRDVNAGAITDARFNTWLAQVCGRRARSLAVLARPARAAARRPTAPGLLRQAGGCR